MAVYMGKLSILLSNALPLQAFLFSQVISSHHKHNRNIRNSLPADYSNSYNHNLNDQHVINPSPSSVSYDTSNPTNENYPNDKLKCLSLNCCSLRSVGKKTSFLALIEEHKPDIICGCESHLDSSYFTAETFPSNYMVPRKDRTEGAGGVFICVRKSLNVSEMPELNSNAELIWAKVTLPKKAPIYQCSYYCPPNTLVDPILQLKASLNKLTHNQTKFLNIILMGDFNLPGISWTNVGGQIVSVPTYGLEVNSTFLDLVNDHGFEQFVSSPTRQSNTLDLVFSTYQNITDVVVTPGMSDHEAIIFSIHTACKLIQNKAEHRIPLYHKADITNIKNYLTKFQNTFIASDPLSRSVEQNWLEFKAAITESVVNHACPTYNCTVT